MDYDDEGKQVVVVPKNEDRFVISARDAAEACQMAHDRDCFVEQFRAVLNRLAQWLKEHAEAFTDAFVTVRDGGLLFVVVRKESPFDPAFEDQLSDLDLEIAQDEHFNRISLDVLALPRVTETAYESFLHPECTWVFKHGE